MANYNVLAKVNQIVTKDVQLLIKANDPEDAEDKARTALMDYPGPVADRDVRRISTIKTNHWVPRDIDIVTIEKEGVGG